MESVWPVSKLSTESVSSRRELVANCVHTADADATKQLRRVGVGGVYWALRYVLSRRPEYPDHVTYSTSTLRHHQRLILDVFACHT